MWVQWTILLSLMLSFSVAGNIFVLVAVLAHRQRTAADYFLLNLSCADLTMAFFNGIPNIWYLITRDWIFGRIMCSVNNFFANFTVSSNVFTMTALAMDRWHTAMHPLQPSMTLRSAIMVILAVWLSSGILAAPLGFFSQTIDHFNTTDCIVIWPDEKNTDESVHDFTYNLCYLVITFAVPMVIIGVAYVTLSCEHWGQTHIAEPTESQATALKSKKRTARILFLGTSTFACCWIPYHGYLIWMNLDGNLILQPWARLLFVFFYFLGMSTSVINPFVYLATNKQFKDFVRSTFRIGRLWET